MDILLFTSDKLNGSENMSKEKIRDRFHQYNKAVAKLKEALKEEPGNPLLYDGVIQRFEFTYELAWKLMKSYLESEGIADKDSPRRAFKEAFAAGLITDGQVWIDMIGDRNLTVHTYNEQLAKDMYERIKHNYFSVFLDFRDRMEAEFC